jgi:hypothetical protein
LNELKEKIDSLQRFGDDTDAELIQLLLRGDVKLRDEIRLEELKGTEKVPPHVLDQFMDFLAIPDLKERIRCRRSFKHIAETLSKAMSATEEEDAAMLADRTPRAADNPAC